MTPTRMPKYSTSPSVPLTWTDEDLIIERPQLWRIHKTDGAHPAEWNQFRTYGPLVTARWDPHPTPLDDHKPTGVIYAAKDLRTAVAEVFQDFRRVDPERNRPVASLWTPVRPLTLLDLTGNWPIKMKASAALAFASDKAVSQNWARQIYQNSNGKIDGLWTNSTMTSGGMVTLFDNSSNSLPKYPQFSSPLNDDALWAAIDILLPQIGYEWSG